MRIVNKMEIKDGKAAKADDSYLIEVSTVEALVIALLLMKHHNEPCRDMAKMIINKLAESQKGAKHE